MKTINIKPQLAICLSALLLFSLIFYSFPQIDWYISGLFFSSHRFMVGDIFSIAQVTLRLAILLAGLYSFGLIVVGLIKKSSSQIKGGIFIILCFLIAPGLIVNLVLKDQWGRPRPAQTSLFSGHLAYQRVWVKTDECPTNCSFVAGDSSAALTFLAFAFLPMSRRLRRFVAGSALGFFVFNACMRIMHGRHYFSDVVIGALLVYLIILLLYRLIYGPETAGNRA